MATRRLIPLVLWVTLLIWGCGGGELSLTEYVEQLNALMDRAGERYEVLVASPEGAVLIAEGEQLTDFTPEDLQVGLERLGEIEVDVVEAAGAIEAPELIASLHDRLFDTRFTIAREALAARAGIAADWEELSESPEMAAYRAAIAGDLQACVDIQAELDATAERGDFADAPWIPDELKEVVDSVLGCAGWPDNPEDIYRPPPASTP